MSKMSNERRMIRVKPEYDDQFAALLVELQPRAVFPSSPTVGTTVVLSGDGHLYTWDGSAWTLAAEGQADCDEESIRHYVLCPCGSELHSEFVSCPVCKASAPHVHNGFFGLFACPDDVWREFNIEPDPSIRFVLAAYECAEYSGQAQVIFMKDGQLYEVHASHCSCHGLEDQWSPEEADLEAILMRPEWRDHEGLSDEDVYVPTPWRFEGMPKPRAKWLTQAVLNHNV